MIKLAELPSDDLWREICKNSSFIYRQEQANSNLPNHKEYADAWIQGFKYGVQTVCASFKPVEARARLDALQALKHQITALTEELARQVKDADSIKLYYLPKE